VFSLSGYQTDFFCVTSLSLISLIGGSISNLQNPPEKEFLMCIWLLWEFCSAYATEEGATATKEYALSCNPELVLSNSKTFLHV
jgi:hypothetical protein